MTMLTNPTESICIVCNCRQCTECVIYYCKSHKEKHLAVIHFWRNNVSFGRVLLIWYPGIFMWSDCAYLRERLATNLILHLLNTWSIVKVVVSVWRAVTKNQNSAAGGIRSLDQNVPVSFHCNMCVFALAVNIRMAHWYYTYTNLFDFHHQQPLHLRLQIQCTISDTGENVFICVNTRQFFI